MRDGRQVPLHTQAELEIGSAGLAGSVGAAGTGAPEAELEVTPEMIDAGHRALDGHYLGNGRFDLTNPTLVALFRAMAAAR